MARFRIDDAHEILRDPRGHEHHWTILAGRLEVGLLCLGDALAIPRVAGGFWVSRVLAFELFRRKTGRCLSAATYPGQTMGLVVWGVAPPRGSVAAGDARTVGPSEAAALLQELERLEPLAINHCKDCSRVSSLRQEALRERH
jgi:hypothetical protein